MKRSCPYCGRIHDYSYVCPHKTEAPIVRYDAKNSKFRSSKLWQSKRAEILLRDKGLCVACRCGIDCEPDLIPADSVHHIVPLTEDFELRLENDNLISLCDYHHQRAERGDIPKAQLLRLISD